MAHFDEPPAKADAVPHTIALCISREVGVIGEKEGFSEETSVNKNGKRHKTGRGQVDNIRVEILQRRVYSTYAEGNLNLIVQRETKT